MHVIIRILFFAFIIWLIRHFLITIRDFKRTRPVKKPLEETGIMVKDPVCGIYLDQKLAVRFDERDMSVYFCSETCKSKYLSGSIRD